MTKVSVLGQPNEEKKELKKIELKFHCERNNEENRPINYEDQRRPYQWQNLILVRFNFHDGMDLILGFDDEVALSGNRCRSLMLGHWNDGIV